MRRAAPVLLLAALLRLARATVRWQEDAWLYAAYPAHTLEALRAGRLCQALTGFTGLHPPLFSLLHALSELWAPVPAVWLLGSVLASWGAVAVIARVDPLAGLLLATAPTQVQYAAEVNDYPLVALVVGLAWAARVRGRAQSLGVAGAVATWTHPLAAISAGWAALSLRGRRGALVLGAMALAALPLVPGALKLAADPGSRRQPPFELHRVASDFAGRYGLIGLLLVPFAVRGARRLPAVALGWAGTAAAIAGFVALHIAAPHQFPYLVALGAPAALLISAGARGRWRWGVVAVALAQAGWQLAFDGRAIGRIVTDPPRAIDVALSELRVPWSCGRSSGTPPPSPACSGDALYLLAPNGINDDDKRRFSPVLWRLRPWWPMPMVRPYDFDLADYRQGQPRLVRGFVVYVNDQVRPSLARAIAAHRRLWLVVHDAGRREAFTTGLERRLGRAPELVGDDELWRLGQAGGE